MRDIDGNILSGTGEAAVCQVNNTIMRKHMIEVGFNPDSFLSWARKNGVIRISAGKNSITQRINGVSTRCYEIKLGMEFDGKPIEEQYTVIKDPDLPF